MTGIAKRDELARRTLALGGREDDRYWWFKFNHYVPPLYKSLVDDEWQAILDWYDETDERFPGTAAETNITAMSMLQGLICGSGIRRIVQCGHYRGYSTLLLGFFARSMGFRNSIFSIDKNRMVTKYVQTWIERTGLEDYVHLCVSDSAKPKLPARARAYFGGEAIQLVFIDSSHQYRHTTAELALWYAELASGGFLVLHDVSRYAAAFDSKHAGGVYRAVAEWKAGLSPNALWINDFLFSGHRERIVYLDACGLGLIQKPGRETLEGCTGGALALNQKQVNIAGQVVMLGRRILRRIARLLGVNMTAGSDKRR
jgi:predicted O-methyltransferase YrrM